MSALLFKLLLHPLMQRETSEILLSHGSKHAWQALVIAGLGLGHLHPNYQPFKSPIPLVYTRLTGKLRRLHSVTRYTFHSCPAPRVT